MSNSAHLRLYASLDVEQVEPVKAPQMPEHFVTYYRDLYGESIAGAKRVAEAEQYYREALARCERPEGQDRKHGRSALTQA